MLHYFNFALVFAALFNVTLNECYVFSFYSNSTNIALLMSHVVLTITSSLVKV